MAREHIKVFVDVYLLGICSSTKIKSYRLPMMSNLKDKIIVVTGGIGHLETAMIKDLRSDSPKF